MAFRYSRVRWPMLRHSRENGNPSCLNGVPKDSIDLQDRYI
jgi:hypothetical protein